MKNDNDYVIVREGEIWRCTGISEPYDYLALYVGSGFITGYTLSTYGPKTRDEQGVTVDDITYWYHPAKINYIRKSRLDYRICEPISDEALHAARYYLTKFVGCDDYVESLKQEVRKLTVERDVYKNALNALGSQKSEKTPETTETPTTNKTDILFYSRLGINDYIAYADVSDCKAPASIRTRATNLLTRYLERRYKEDAYPISYSSIALIVWGHEFACTNGIGSISVGFLRKVFQVNPEDEGAMRDEE